MSFSRRDFVVENCSAAAEDVVSSFRRLNVKLVMFVSASLQFFLIFIPRAKFVRDVSSSGARPGRAGARAKSAVLSHGCR